MRFSSFAVGLDVSSSSSRLLEGEFLQYLRIITAQTTRTSRSRFKPILCFTLVHDSPVRMRFSILAAFFLSLVAAIDAVDYEQRVLGLQTAEPPAPTSPPEAWMVRWRLEPRQTADQGTCGWINGNSANAVTCSPGYVCAHNTANTVFGCCSGNLNTCTLPTVCFDSTLAAAISATANGFTEVCAKGSATFCTTYIAASGAYIKAFTPV